MVVKMMKWSPWPPTNSKKFQVKVKPLKLQDFNINDGFEEEKTVMAIEMKWKGPKVSLSSLRRWSSSTRNVTLERIKRNGIDVEWDDEFESVCSFPIFQKDNSFQPWEVSFNLLFGQNGDSKNKFVLIGSVSLNIAELVSQEEAETERKIPISFQVAGVTGQATLLVSVSFVELRTESVEIGTGSSTESDKEEGFFRMVKDITGISKSKKKKKKKKNEETNDEIGSNRFLVDTDESTTFDSETSPDNNLGLTPSDSEFVTKVDDSSLLDYKEMNVLSQVGRSMSLGSQSDSVIKAGFWRKRKLSFRSVKKKDEPLTEKKIVDQNSVSSKEITKEREATSSSPSTSQEQAIGVWEEKELISRDGQTKLKTNVFFASMDQRSEKAAGESACTALVAVIADWLQSNPKKTPSLLEFETLITEGSLEWRKLCDNETYLQNFPDKHFDLETVLVEAKVRPLCVRSEKSFIGFFCPESFESLKGAMSFDSIWEEISKTLEEEDQQPKVYIVSWNDHFFVLKVEANAYYLIDTLGERLFEGCNQAYILKFDNSSTMSNLSKKEIEKKEEVVDKERESDQEMVPTNDDSGGEDDKMLVSSGKECCREFIKRFLAAITLRELEIEEKKGTLSSVIPLHQRLQVEFHFTSLLSIKDKIVGEQTN